MALLQALCAFTHLPGGFRNRDLLPHVEAFFGRPYATARMTYDLRRLPLKGPIHRIPKTHRYTATSYGLKAAFFWAALLPDDDLCSLRSAQPSINWTSRTENSTRKEAVFAACNTCFRP